GWLISTNRHCARRINKKRRTDLTLVFIQLFWKGSISFGYNLFKVIINVNKKILTTKIFMN
ncbi:MAG: hypothetical protein ONB11_11705, partial [candidate division KSB1 bacterium]|nr:hypothetical protein [candidate division KSB1 bacterium]